MLMLAVLTRSYSVPELDGLLSEARMLADEAAGCASQVSRRILLFRSAESDGRAA